MRDSHFDLDSPIRMAAFEQVKKLSAVYTHIPAGEIRKGFSFEGKRIPLVNPQRGIFRPKEMKFLLSIRTVFPKTSARVRYEDQIDIHRKIFENLESIDYAFMGTNPDATDNKWLREAYENKTPVIYFLGIAPWSVSGNSARFYRGLGWNLPESQNTFRQTRPDQNGSS